MASKEEHEKFLEQVKGMRDPGVMKDAQKQQDRAAARIKRNERPPELRKATVTRTSIVDGLLGRKDKGR